MIIILIPVKSAVTIGLSMVKTTDKRIGNVNPTQTPIKKTATFDSPLCNSYYPESKMLFLPLLNCDFSTRSVYKVSGREEMDNKGGRRN